MAQGEFLCEIQLENGLVLGGIFRALVAADLPAAINHITFANDPAGALGGQWQYGSQPAALSVSESLDQTLYYVGATETILNQAGGGLNLKMGRGGPGLFTGAQGGSFTVQLGQGGPAGTQGSDGTFTVLDSTGTTVFQFSASTAVFSVSLQANSITSLGGIAAGVVSGGFSGDGSLITGLNASNIASGTLNNARLSGVALTGSANTFTVGPQTFQTTAPSAPGSGTNSEQWGSGASATGLDATAVGKNAAATVDYSTAVGEGATASTGANNCTAIGALSSATAAGATAIGRGAAASGALGVAIGQNITNSGVNSLVLGSNSSSAFNNALVMGIGSAAGGAGSIVLGTSATGSAANEFVAGSSAQPINTVYFGKGVTDAAPTAYTINGTGGTGSNIAGGAVVLAGGKGTGNAIGGDVPLQTAAPGGSGTTLQTLGDRQRTLAKYTTLTETTATAFTRANVPSGTVAGGFLSYAVEANDATDYQALTGLCPWAVANKGGTLTLTLGTDSQASACSSGTLTGTLTLVDSGSGNADFKMNATSSLTQTTLRINAQVWKNFGTGALSAQ